MNRTILSAIGLLLITGSGTAMGQELMIYPANGQDKEQQDFDEFQCYGWAKEQSGFDPMAPPTATEAPPEQQAAQGGVVRGAAGGAAVGAIIDGGDGAAKGAAAGAVLGGMRRRGQQRDQAQKNANWEEQQVEQYTRNRNNYNRAYATCLQGRGYTVN